MSGERNPHSRARFDHELHRRVGRVLQELRDERHWSLTQAGIAGSFYATNLIKHERGSRPLSLAQIHAYLKAYGVTWELFGEKLHRLDMIRPNDVDPAQLNRIRRQREAQGLNIFTGRPATTRCMNRGPDVVTDGPANPSIETLHALCRRCLRRAPAVRWPAAATSTRKAA
jgi:hypothetical protein